MTLDHMPEVAVRAALTTDPTDPPAWTDISDSYVRSFSVRRGRETEWERVSAGEGAALLKNQDRRFDPTHATGPYYGTLRPLRRLQIRATYGGVTHYVFTGYVRGWPQAWEANGEVGHADVRLVDGFHVLARARLNASYGQQLSSERIKSVLNDVLWGSGQAWVLGNASFALLGTTTILGPVGDRSISVGQSSIQASVLANVPALDHLLAVAFDNENGRLFIGKDGAVVFQDRHLAIREQRYATSQATWGDGGGSELPYSDLELEYDEQQIENEIRLQRVGGSEQVAEDTTSQDRYFPVTHSNTQLLLTSDSEVASAAAWRLSRRKEPAVRVVAMTVSPSRDPATLWPVVLGAELGDRWTIKRRPPGGGSAIEQQSFIEGIEHAASPAGWTVRYRFSPADTATYWILGTTSAGVSYSVLGSTTRLAY